MPTPASKVIDLRSIQNEIAGRIELNEGAHDVRRLNVGQYQAAMAIGQDGQTALDVSVQLVTEIVPTLPEAQVRKLPPQALAAIIALASQGIEAVEALLPNAPSPENPSSTSPG